LFADLFALLIQGISMVSDIIKCKMNETAIVLRITENNAKIFLKHTWTSE
jgi:hypothetical protein